MPMPYRFAPQLPVGCPHDTTSLLCLVAQVDTAATHAAVQTPLSIQAVTGTRVQ